MRIGVTGSSGLIGRALVRRLLAEGHGVRRLVRRPPRDGTEHRWHPGVPAPEAVAGLDAVIHLAGAGLADRRWTAGYQAEVLRSRIDGTSAIAESIARCPDGPRVLLSASAIGCYGDTGDRLVDETAPVGTGFLAGTVARWETATAPAEAAGLRVCHLRSGIVLAAGGGALGRALPLFRIGLGGRLGSGRQYLSWISLTDEVSAISWLLRAEAVHGPVNLTAPEPVRNAEYAAAVARALRRPAVLAVPGPALRLVLGAQLADEALLCGQRVRPGVLLGGGFGFRHPSLEEALAAALGLVTIAPPRPAATRPPPAPA